MISPRQGSSIYKCSERIRPLELLLDLGRHNKEDFLPSYGGVWISLTGLLTIDTQVLTSLINDTNAYSILRPMHNDKSYTPCSTYSAHDLGKNAKSVVFSGLHQIIVYLMKQGASLFQWSRQFIRLSTHMTIMLWALVGKSCGIRPYLTATFGEKEHLRGGGSLSFYAKSVWPRVFRKLLAKSAIFQPAR